MMAYMVAEQPNMKARILAGAATGLIAGFVMSLVMMLYHIFITGRGMFFMPNLVATWGGLAFEPGGFGMNTMAGMMIHLIFSAFLGILFALLLPRMFNPGVTALLGIVYSLFSYWLVDIVIAPQWTPIFAQMTAEMGAPFIWAHVLFGALFFIYPKLAKAWA